MIIALIVAASENNVIGCKNRLIWHLSDDLKRFKKLTTGHTIIMGRKTFDSIGKALPNRRNIVITRNPACHAPGCECASSIEDALDRCKDEERVFIIGGGSIYHEVWNKADELYLTRIHTEATGDTYIPNVTHADWTCVKEETHEEDEKNPYSYSFIDYIKNCK